MKAPAHAQEMTFGQRIALLLAHACAAMSVVVVGVWATGSAKMGYLGGLGITDPNKLFNWHPVLSVAAVALTSTEALLSFRTLPPGLDRRAAKLVHMAWQTLTIALLSLSFRAVFVFHARTKRGDLWSVHSWMGMAVLLAYCLNYAVGLLAFVLDLATEPLKARLLPYHAALGTLAYIAGIFTAHSGIAEKMIFQRVCSASAGTRGAHYSGLLKGCRLGDWLGLLLMSTGVLAAFAILPLARRLSTKQGHAPLASSAGGHEAPKPHTSVDVRDDSKIELTSR